MDPAACEQLFRQSVEEHMGIFLKTAHGFAPAPADRQDLVQEILLAVWQALPAYHGDCKLSTFLYRTAHNRALNWLRSRSRYHRKLENFTVLPHLTIAPGHDAERERQLEWLYAAIHRLPPTDRTLIMLQLDRLTLREIADVTGLSESNVGVRLHRIKHTLASQKHEYRHDL